MTLLHGKSVQNNRKGHTCVHADQRRVSSLTYYHHILLLVLQGIFYAVFIGMCCLKKYICKM